MTNKDRSKNLKQGEKALLTYMSKAYKKEKVNTGLSYSLDNVTMKAAW
jgi:hypothetical protein